MQLSGGLQVVENRWRKFGNDRLYVKTMSGVEMGYANLANGQVVPELPEFREHLVEVMQRWYEAFPSIGTGLPISSGLEVLNTEVLENEILNKEVSVSEDSVREVRDYSKNKPGQAVKAKWKSVNTQGLIGRSLRPNSDTKTDDGKWRVGYEGEVLAGKQLAKLGKDFRVLHSVCIGSRECDIDHVVIGPPGVFSVNTKHNRGGAIRVYEFALYVNGSQTCYLEKSRAEAKSAAKKLHEALGFEVAVASALIFVASDPKKSQLKHQPDGVYVSTPLGFVQWLKSQPTLLDSPTVEAIYQKARWSDTWA